MYMTIYEVFGPQLFGLLRHYVLKPWFALSFIIADLHDMAGLLVQKSLLQVVQKYILHSGGIWICTTL